MSEKVWRERKEHGQAASAWATLTEGADLASCVHCRWVSVSVSVPDSFFQLAFAVQTVAVGGMPFDPSHPLL